MVCDTKSDKYFLVVNVVENENFCSSRRTFSDIPKWLSGELSDESKTVLRLNPTLKRVVYCEGSSGKLGLFNSVGTLGNRLRRGLLWIVAGRKFGWVLLVWGSA